MLLINNFLDMFKDLVSSRRLIFELAKKDFRSKYLGSYFGVFWAFVQPTIMVLIFWFIFEIGFRNAPVNNIPYILYFSTSIVPWFFFSECLASATNSVLDNSYLVKKVVFKISILPSIKIISALFIHLFFLIFIFFIYIIYGYNFSLYNLQILYFLFALIVLLVGLTWITSAIIVFFKDMGQIVAMILQFGFWLTPIFWSLNMMPEKYHFYIKLLPMYYIIEGYRNAILFKVWFWQHDLYLTFYFWGLCLLFLIIGAFIYRKLSSHFADVL